MSIIFTSYYSLPIFICLNIHVNMLQDRSLISPFKVILENNYSIFNLKFILEKS